MGHPRAVYRHKLTEYYHTTAYVGHPIIYVIELIRYKAGKLLVGKSTLLPERPNMNYALFIFVLHTITRITQVRKIKEEVFPVHILSNPGILGHLRNDLFTDLSVNLYTRV